MGYSQIQRPWGFSPRQQEPGHADLQGSGSGAQKIEFGAYDEIFIEFHTACKVTVSADASEAASDITADKYNQKAGGDFGSFYKEDGEDVFVTNDSSSSVSDALDYVKYKY